MSRYSRWISNPSSFCHISARLYLWGFSGWFWENSWLEEGSAPSLRASSMMALLRTIGLGTRGYLHRCGNGDEGENGEDDVLRCGELIFFCHSMISEAEGGKLALGSDWELSLVIGFEGCCPRILASSNYFFWDAMIRRSSLSSAWWARAIGDSGEGVVGRLAWGSKLVVLIEGLRRRIRSSSVDDSCWSVLWLADEQRWYRYRRRWWGAFGPMRWLRGCHSFPLWPCWSDRSNTERREFRGFMMNCVLNDDVFKNCPG